MEPVVEEVPRSYHKQKSSFGYSLRPQWPLSYPMPSILVCHTNPLCVLLLPLLWPVWQLNFLYPLPNISTIPPLHMSKLSQAYLYTLSLKVSP